MVHENMVEKSGHSTQPKALHRKHCEYYLFDRVPECLMSSSAVQKYLAVELEISETCILVGSQLPRGGWEAWIHREQSPGNVVRLPRGGRGTRRPNRPQTPEIEPTTPSRHAAKTNGTPAEPAPFNESEWALNALLHLLENPNLRVRITTLLTETLQETLPRLSRPSGRSISRPRTSRTKFHARVKDMRMSEMCGVQSPAAQRLSPLSSQEPKPGLPGFDSSRRPSFADIAKMTREEKNQKSCEEFIPVSTGAVFASEKSTGSEKTEFIDVRPQDDQYELQVLHEQLENKTPEVETPFTEFVEQGNLEQDHEKTDQIQEPLICKWYEEPEDWDLLLAPDDDDDEEETKRRRQELCSSFLRLEESRTCQRPPDITRRRFSTKQVVWSTCSTSMTAFGLSWDGPALEKLSKT